jgi:hypothetical protein
MKGQHYAGSSELLDTMADAYLRAEFLASHSPEYEALAEVVGVRGRSGGPPWPGQRGFFSKQSHGSPTCNTLDGA